MGLRHSYTLLSPIYDFVVAGPTEKIRRDNLKKLDREKQTVLISGVGSGLDIPHLPGQHDYTGFDITPAMLRKAEQRAKQYHLNIRLDRADAMQLPYADNSFDIIIMHLILAVVPHPERALQEAQRVLKPGGSIHILDKFIHQGQLAPVRRLTNVFIRHIATRTNVVFENLLNTCDELKLVDDKPVLLKGWFRSIDLEKR